MQHRFFKLTTAFSTFIIFSLLFGSSLASLATTAPNEPYKVIVKFKQPQSLLSQIHSQTVASITHSTGAKVKTSKALGENTYAITLDKKRFNQLSLKGQQHPQQKMHDLVKILNQRSDIEYAVVDVQLHMLAIDRNPSHRLQWDEFSPPGGVMLDGPHGAWCITRGNPDITVAVLDTGIAHHNDLSNNILPGFSFVTQSNDTTDSGNGTHYHGTHVSGTIAANGKIQGMAPAVKVLPVQVLGDDGSGSLSDILAGFYWAAGINVPGLPENSRPAQVINMSLGGSGPCNPAWVDAIETVRQHGASIVVAAGNEDNDAMTGMPANCPGVITVAATNQQGNRSYYSNYGAMVNIAAPGGETHPFIEKGILSTVKDDYTYMQGTSMATPHVAGIISLMYSVYPQITPTQVDEIIKETATPFPGTNGIYSCLGDQSCGAGIINAAAAVKSAQSLAAQ